MLWTSQKIILSSRRVRRLTSIFCVASFCFITVARAELSRLSEVELRNLDELFADGFVADVENAQIFAGKKTLFLDPAADPLVGNNNFRQFLRRKSGIFLTEEEIQGIHFNVGLHGMTPNNAVFTQVYLDGFPLNVDTFGTRFVASIPDVNQITQAQFADGAIYLFSYPAAGDQPWRFRSTSAFGSFGYFSELAEISGTVDDFSYAVFGRYARGDGFRVQPSFDNISAGFRVTKRFENSVRLTLDYQTYQFDSDQISGVARNTTGVNNVLNYYYQVAKQHFVNVLFERDFAADSRMETRVWYHDTDGFRDFSQTLAPTLGPTTEKLHYAGLDARFVREYNCGNFVGNALVFGVTAQGASSPIRSEPTRAGEARLDLDRYDLNFAAFVENKFQLAPRWSVTPAVRVEYAKIYGKGIRGDGGANNFATVYRAFDDVEPLFSLGTEFDVIEPSGLRQRPMVLYANASKGYRPPTYNEFIMQAYTTTVAGDLKNATLYQGEIGVRGTPTRWFLYDFSGFWMEFDDQFATVGGVMQNFGRTRHRGLEFVQEIDWFGLVDALNGVAPSTQPRVGPRSPQTETGLARYGRFSLFTAVTYLDAEIERSPFAGAEGMDVPYAPEWTAKVGLAYNFFERIKAVLSLTHVSNHLGNLNNDNLMLRNNGAAQIPAYSVLDFSLELATWNDRLTFFFNLNNALDENYFAGLQGGATVASQIRAPGRNFYGGFRLAF
jgi:Fe(3+) dicitrate transport protein